MNETLRGLLVQPAETGLFFDFDGTLSEIVNRPQDARPVNGAPEALAELAELFGVVAIVSGRGAGELLEWLGPDVEIWGVHGAERSHDGAVELSDRALPFRQPMSEVLTDARRAVAERGLEGVVVEDKTVMCVLHYRAASDQDRAQAELEEIARSSAAAHGMSVAPHKMVIEIRPPVEFSKAQVVLERVRSESLSAAAFVGDDVVDLPAFRALDRLAGEGVSTLRVAVDSIEAPEELLSSADVVLGGTTEVVSWMKELASAARRRD